MLLREAPEDYWKFPKIRGTLLGGLIVRILLFSVLYWGPLFSETPKSTLSLQRDSVAES